MSRDNRFVLLILSAIGLPFLIIGLVFTIFLADAMNEEAARVAVLTPMSATRLSDTPPGREILVEGRVSDRNSLRFRSYVAFIVEECEIDRDGDEECRVVNRVTPPLEIALPDGPVQIANDTYSLQGMTSTAYQGDLEYSGIEAGAPVIVVGTLAPRDGSPQLQAEFIAHGTQADYIASQRIGSIVWRLFGLLFAVIGAALIIAALVLALRSWSVTKHLFQKKSFSD